MLKKESSSGKSTNNESRKLFNGTFKPKSNAPFTFVLKALKLREIDQNDVVRRRLTRVKSKKLPTQAILNKIFGTKQRKQIKLNKRKNFWYLLLRDF